MADATITAANVAAGSSRGQKTVTYGATITRGMTLALQADGKWDPANADGAGTAVAAGANGLAYALTDGANGQPGVILDGDAVEPFNPGFTATEGEVYVVSAAAAGGIAPIGDLVALDNDFVSIIGVGDENGEIVPIFKATGAHV